ncbi:MAG: hypothetical protein ACI4TT_01860 [Christensenellales bacterium]
MKKNILVKFNILLIVLMLLLGISLMFNTQQPTKTVFADNSEELKIENDGMVISTELWVALYNAYTNTYNEKPAGDVLTLDMFKDFPVKILNLSTNAQGQSYGISSISGLGEFDLSAFDTINLSGNQIYSLGDELTNIQNLKKLDLSNNALGSFKTNMLSSSSLSSLEVLNLSNNQISVCDLTGLNENVNIDLSGNKLTADKITFPQVDCKINLNNNYILQPDVERLNTVYGYQGAKNGDSYEANTDILFLASDDISFSKVEIYKDEEFFDTLTDGEKITLLVGNYQLKFLNSSDTEVLEAISFKVLLPKVTAKLFVNGEEIEWTSVLTQNTTIKFYGEDGAEIFVSANSDEAVVTTEYEITQNGTVIITVYQTKDGYRSNATSFYFTVRKSMLSSWIILGVGIIGFILLYFIFKYILNSMINKSSKTTYKGKLD